MQYTVTRYKNFEIREYTILDSTNLHARRLLDLENYNDFVIVAHSQTAGKGRSGKEWISEPGNLFFSLIIDSARIIHPHNLSYVAALSVSAALENYGLSPQIKWPNDIMVNERKCCGILIEKTKDNLIIGIGINISSSPEYLDSGRVADHLKNHNADISATQLLLQILDQFKKYREIYERSFEPVREELLTKFYRLHEMVEINYLGRKVTGKIKGISSTGNLQIINSSGETEEFNAGEIFSL